MNSKHEAELKKLNAVLDEMEELAGDDLPAKAMIGICKGLYALAAKQMAMAEMQDMHMAVLICLCEKVYGIRTSDLEKLVQRVADENAVGEA